MKNEEDIVVKRIKLFLLIEFILAIITTLPLFIFNAKDGSIFVMIISIIFMFLPVLATLITRKITKDNSNLYLKPNFKKNWKVYLIAIYIPSILIIFGTIIYFAIFPNHLDLSLGFVKSFINTTNQETVIPTLSIKLLLIISFGLILAAPLVIVNHILAFGEEFGWRGYLLPLLCEKIGTIKGILINGILWGMVHAPLVCFGANYTGNYIGRPFTGILMMIVFAVSLGILLSYLTIKTKSIIPACISHGVINAIREAPLFICISSYNALLGPKPSGIIGMFGFILLDIMILVRLYKEK